MKFLRFLTQRLSFCSTNVVKVQVSSILKGKKFRCDKRFEPGVPDRQSSSLSIKPLDHRGSFSVLCPIVSIYFVYASQHIQGRFEIWKQVLTIFK